LNSAVVAKKAVCGMTMPRIMIKERMRLESIFIDIEYSIFQ